MKLSRFANLQLVFIAAIWGATFPLIKNAISHIDPLTFVVIRFSAASLILLPLAIMRFKATSRDVLIAGIVLGLLNAGTYTLQTTGLQTVDSSRAAFITGMNVIMVPFVLPLFKLSAPKRLDILSVLLCSLGLYILTGANLHHITRGDIWILLAALCSALSIAYIQWSAHKITQHTLLAFYQICFTWPLASVLIFPVDTQVFNNTSVIIGLLFCAAFATSLALFLQVKYQKHTTATKAALIFMLEPVFASLFGYVINGEALTRHVIVGGAIIFASITLPDILCSLKNKKPPQA